MAKSTTFEFDEFGAGYFLAWTISSQCANTGKVEITSGGKTLASVEKKTRDCNFTLLGQSNAVINSNTVQVTVTINEATIELKNSQMEGPISDNLSRKVGYTHVVCVEDSTDNDYNDICVSLVGWERRG
jgi:phage tail sheath gpL-like